VWTQAGDGDIFRGSSGSSPQGGNLKITQGGGIWAVRCPAGGHYRLRLFIIRTADAAAAPLPPARFPLLSDLLSLADGRLPHSLDHLVPRKNPLNLVRFVLMWAWCFRLGLRYIVAVSAFCYLGFWFHFGEVTGALGSDGVLSADLQ
jgi:hypothetical protein